VSLASVASKMIAGRPPVGTIRAEVERAVIRGVRGAASCAGDHGIAGFGTDMAEASIGAALNLRDFLRDTGRVGAVLGSKPVPSLRAGCRATETFGETP
jgi:hypothetical protein